MILNGTCRRIILKLRTSPSFAKGRTISRSCPYFRFPKLLYCILSASSAMDRPVIVAHGRKGNVASKPDTAAKYRVVLVCVPIAHGLRWVRRWQILAKERIERVDESPRLLRQVVVDLPNVLWLRRVESSAFHHLGV